MLDKKIKSLVEKSKKYGWILEHDAMALMSEAGLDVARHVFAETEDEAAAFAEKCGYPVVAKVTSPEIIHKSDVGGVVVGIDNEKDLRGHFQRFSKMNGFIGIVVAEMLKGTELIIGSKTDQQFGPVVLLGIGGVGVEIYKDTAIRMAPLKEDDIDSMIKDIEGHQLITGFRGSDPVDIDSLKSLIVTFSNLIMELEPYIESADLNPVICSGSRSTIADARMILSKKGQNEID